MGVYIRGMEMPEEDEEIMIRIDSSGTVMTEYALPITRVKAVSVPPHGDLIDRDALVRKFEEIEESIGYAEVPLALAVTGAINDIKKTPTVIEAEGGE